MKAMDLRRIQREAERERNKQGLPVLDLRKLLAIEQSRKAILEASQAGRIQQRGGDKD